MQNKKQHMVRLFKGLSKEIDEPFFSKNNFLRKHANQWDEDSTKFWNVHSFLLRDSYTITSDTITKFEDLIECLVLLKPVGFVVALFFNSSLIGLQAKIGTLPKPHGFALVGRSNHTGSVFFHIIHMFGLEYKYKLWMMWYKSN